MAACQPPSGGSRPVAIGSRSIGVSLQPAIPRRVAPQQSPLPLHRSPTIVAQSRSDETITRAAVSRRACPPPPGGSFLFWPPGSFSFFRPCLFPPSKPPYFFLKTLLPKS